MQNKQTNKPLVGYIPKCFGDKKKVFSRIASAMEIWPGGAFLNQS